MRQGRAVWVVLAGVVTGAAAIDVVASGGAGGPTRPPALALGSGRTPVSAESNARSLPVSGEVRYEVRGTLPDLPDRAPVWRMGTTLDPQRLRRLAAALGLAGAAVAGADGWALRDGDSELRVARDPGRPWLYRASVPASEPPQRPANFPTENFPTEQQAERAARRLLADAGVGLAGAEVRLTEWFSGWQVTVKPLLGGLPVVSHSYQPFARVIDGVSFSGWEWTVVVGSGGIVELATGWLALPVRGDDYPLGGTAAGLERLQAGWGWKGPARHGEPEAIVPSPGCEGDCPPPAAVARTVTGVRLALLYDLGAELGDEVLFVPAYVFELHHGEDDGEEVPVLAVAEEFLRPAA